MTLTVESEWAFLRRKADGGGATPGDVDRMNELQRRMIERAVAAALAKNRQAAQRQPQRKPQQRR